MSTTHTGSIHPNVTDGAIRRRGPGKNFDPIGKALPAKQPVIILCYSEGETVTFKNDKGETNTSNAWDFVVVDDQDPGGYVADVLINTGGDIKKQLGSSNTCQNLAKRF